MKIGINIKLDVTKIDKDKLFVGAKGKYLDAVAFIDIDNKGQYGDNGMITQQVTKEEKEQGVKGVILGNGTVFWTDGQQAQPRQAPQQYQQQQAPTKTNEFNNSFDEDIPF